MLPTAVPQRVPPSPLRAVPRALLTLAAAVAALLLSAACLARLPAADNPPADEKAEAALKALADRSQDMSGDKEKLAQDVVAFRVAYPGTPYSVRAAALLSQLPSPLDKLDPTAIPEIERFKWQPKELVAVIGEHRGRQGGQVTCVAASPDGILVASGGGSLIRVWKPADMRLLSVTGHYAVVALAFGHDGKTLVSAGGDGFIRVWDIAEGGELKQRLAVQAAASTPVSSVAIAPDEKSVSAGCSDNSVRMYDISDKEPKDLHTVNDHGQPVTSVAYTPDGKTLASGGNDKTVRLWDVTPDKLIAKAVLDGPATPVLSVAIAPNASALAASCSDGTIHVWNLPATSKSKERAILPAAGGVVYSVAFTKDGGTLAAACADGTVRLWATSGAPKEERVKLPGHAAAATCVAYGLDDKVLYSGGQDWVVRSWEPATKKERFQPSSHLSHVYAAAFAPDGKTLATGAEDHELRLWDLKQTPTRTRNYAPPHADSTAIYCIAFSPDGKDFVVGGNSTTATMYETAAGRPNRAFAGHPAGVSALAFTPDGKQMLSASGKVLIVWDALKGVETSRFKEHETGITCMALSPDGRYAVAGSGYYLYDKAGKLTTDKDGKVVYTDCVLRMTDVQEGKEVDCNKSAPTPLVSAAFSPDGRFLYSCATEPILRKWDATKQPLAEVSTLMGTSNYASGVLFSPDGKTMCTRVLDGKLIVWDVESGKRLQEWALSENVGGVGYSPDGRYLAVGLGTGVVYVLRLSEPAKSAP